MNAKIERVDFSVAYMKAHFTYDSISGAIREKSTGKLIGSPDSQNGGTIVKHNGKDLKGARIAWILTTGRDIAPGFAICLRQRTPGHYGNRINNLQPIDVIADPNYFD